MQSATFSKVTQEFFWHTQELSMRGNTIVRVDTYFFSFKERGISFLYIRINVQ